MNKTFIAFIIIIILGTGLLFGTCIYIKAEDKIDYSVMAEDGDKALMEGLKMNTLRYADYNDFWYSSWQTETSFEDGVISETKKVIMEDYRKDYWITRRELVYDTSVSVAKYYIYSINNHNNYPNDRKLNAVDKNGENQISFDETNKAMMGDGCLFIWDDGKLYRLDEKLYCDTDYFAYSFVREFPNDIYVARRTKDDKVVVMIIKKEDGNYISVMDAADGHIITEYLLNTEEYDYECSGDMEIIYENGDYIFVKCLEGSDLENRDEKIYVIDTKNGFEICDEFINIEPKDYYNCNFEGYAYNKTDRRLAALYSHFYTEDDGSYVEIDIVQNGTGRQFYGAYMSNLRDWPEYDVGGIDGSNAIGQLELNLSY